jgi:putative Mn2+ efflux pump MntP
MGTMFAPSLGLVNYIGPAVLILLGAYFVFRFFKPQT